MRRSSEAPGALTGLAAAVLLIAGYASLGRPPEPGAPDLDVYAFFLDHRGDVRAAAVLLIAGLALLAAFLTILRGAIDPERRGGAPQVMLTSGLLGIAAASFAAATLGALAAGAESADPASSRALLDLAEAVGALAGVLLAVALAVAAVALRGRGADGHDATIAPRLGLLAALAALACLLWLAPLLTDAGAFEPGSLLGTTLGATLLVAWSAPTALWLLRGRR